MLAACGGMEAEQTPCNGKCDAVDPSEDLCASLAIDATQICARKNGARKNASDLPCSSSDYECGNSDCSVADVSKYQLEEDGTATDAYLVVLHVEGPAGPTLAFFNSRVQHRDDSTCQIDGPYLSNVLY
jgi:hypothetical protein